MNSDEKRPYRRRSNVIGGLRRNVYLSKETDDLFWSVAEAADCSYSEAVDRVAQQYVRNRPLGLTTDKPRVPILVIAPPSN